MDATIFCTKKVYSNSRFIQEVGKCMEKQLERMPGKEKKILAKIKNPQYNTLITHVKCYLNSIKSETSRLSYDFLFSIIIWNLSKLLEELLK